MIGSRPPSLGLEGPRLGPRPARGVSVALLPRSTSTCQWRRGYGRHRNQSGATRGVRRARVACLKAPRRGMGCRCGRWWPSVPRPGAAGPVSPMRARWRSRPARVSGAGVTVTTRTHSGRVVCVTDDVSAPVEELQLTFGEGPCVDAYACGAPVLSADLGLGLRCGVGRRSRPQLRRLVRRRCIAPEQLVDRGVPAREAAPPG
jgi:hypothetical protein